MDLGTGWYNASTDLYKEFYVEGPDNFKVSETTGRTSSVSSTFGASYSAISAEVGFTIGSEYSITWESETAVAAGQNLKIQLYTTFQKKSFDVYEGTTSSTTTTYKGKGYAYKPMGPYIKKTWY